MQRGIISKKGERQYLAGLQAFKRLKRYAEE
jgi:hypothetical protein